jgi:CelD/BcsL family acetyltransferase involved in cellulose biosynthesis
VSSPEVVALEDSATLGALTRDWGDLALRMDGSSYFQSADWVLGWWQTIAGRPPTRLAAWREPSGRLEALVALSEDRARLHGALPVDLRVQVNAGSGPGAADHCGWLVPAGRRPEVAAWLAQAIGGAGLLLRGADPAWERPPLPERARVIEVTTCPRLTLPGPDEAVGRSRELRRQLPRFTRRLEREGVRFEWVAPGQVDEPLLRALFALHGRARAQRVEGTAFGPENLALHLRLAKSGEAGRGPAAVVARHDGTVTGVLYGFWWKDTFAAYQWGWDPAWARFSMGSVLTYHAIRFAARAGARTFDFLRGTEGYKYRFGAVDRQDLTWLVPRGPAGLLLSARYRARDRMRPRRRPEPLASA